MTRVILPIVFVAFIVGCATAPHEPTDASMADEVTDSPTLPASEPANPNDTPVAMSFGRGIARAADDLTFMVNVEIYKDRKVAGMFSFSAQGTTGNLDIEAEVTCIEFDHAAGRGWIGGKLVRNDSSDARYTGQDGDVWIRVLDRNLASLPPKISAPRFPTDTMPDAESFCRQKPWDEAGLFVIQPGALAIFP